MCLEKNDTFPAGILSCDHKQANLKWICIKEISCGIRNVRCPVALGGLTASGNKYMCNEM